MAESTGKKNVFGMFKKGGGSNEVDMYLDQIKKDPDNDRAYIRLAELYARGGDEDSAIEIYEKAALLFEKKGFFNKAKAVLKQALSLNPEHGKINVLLADLDKEDGLIKDAILRYQIAANYYAKIGNRLAAINILKKIIDIYPQNLNYTIKLANLLVAERMYHEAEKILQPLAVKLKGSPQLNEYTSVMRLLYTATENDPQVGKDLVDAYIKGGNFSNALSVLHKLILSEPESIEMLQKLANIFEKLEEKDKLISTYKQIAAIFNKKKDVHESNRYYRKVLAIDSQDKESLLALNEEGKLRQIISDKIDSSTLDEDYDDDEITIQIDDVEGFEIEQAPAPEPKPTQQYNISTILKEAKVFKSYNLFNKGIQKIESFPLWKKDPDALDLMIELCLEKGDVERGQELIFVLMDLYIERNEHSKAQEIFNGVRELIEQEPQFAKYERLFSQGQPAAQQSAAQTPKTADIQPQSKTVTPELDQKPELNESESLLNSMKEPPENKLHELEFFVSMEDFTSATTLLQELLINYPESELLESFRDVIPVRKEEDISKTLGEVKTSLSKEMSSDDKTPEDFYNMGVVHMSMAMYNEAVRYFDNAVQKDPANSKYLISLADAWAAIEKYEQSLKYLLKVLEKTTDQSDKIELLEKISNLYYTIGDTVKHKQTVSQIKLLKQ